MMAFSTENGSLGKPKSPQFLIVTGLPRTFSRLNLPELGISFSWHYFTQKSARSLLKVEVKAPK